MILSLRCLFQLTHRVLAVLADSKAVDDFFESYEGDDVSYLS